MGWHWHAYRIASSSAGRASVRDCIGDDTCIQDSSLRVAEEGEAKHGRNGQKDGQAHHRAGTVLEEDGPHKAAAMKQLRVMVRHIGGRG